MVTSRNRAVETEHEVHRSLPELGGYLVSPPRMDSDAHVRRFAL